MSEVRERRRLLKEGDDGNETLAAFMARMDLIAADAVEVKANGLNAPSATRGGPR